ncbi:MAG: hypothetical protein ACFFDU_08255 [Candidatus Thorarchaeota archaeon]
MAILRTILRWTSLVLALILLIEGAALFIGMVVLSPGNPWVNVPNTLFLIIDILVGAGILRLVIRHSDMEYSLWFFILITTTVITHLYRAVEFFLPNLTKFLFNDALFLMNSLKLGFTLLALVIGLYLFFQSKIKIDSL